MIMKMAQHRQAPSPYVKEEPQQHSDSVVETPWACPSSGSRCQFRSDHQSSCIRDDASHMHISYLTTSPTATLGSQRRPCRRAFRGNYPHNSLPCEITQHHICAVLYAHAKCGLETSAHHSIMRPYHLCLPLGHTSRALYNVHSQYGQSFYRSRSANICMLHSRQTPDAWAMEKAFVPYDASANAFRWHWIWFSNSESHPPTGSNSSTCTVSVLF
ncbi:hypothetical protein F5B22DRAFT_317036 [Xylaria bambusicola]|uniref:uncharacterized protein n=1 Tax=Xylaria bambusicola TaxID=326684 RepID=UPI0020076160|nr:uncharacterized protein F5B22DRAFT_317036 [Xylaria bambusicola]KAI0509577.1 hypothetical protein F5B22DRAFT_317036 [Xylaria bambusicola]